MQVTPFEPSATDGRGKTTFLEALPKEGFLDDEAASGDPVLRAVVYVSVSSLL